MTIDKLNAIFQSIGEMPLSYKHPPLNTANCADMLGVERQGQRLKNLFLRDNYGRRHILLIAPFDKDIDLKAMSARYKVARLGFASKERLNKYLGICPGEVSLLALINDSARDVELWIDESLNPNVDFICHPLTNEESWVLTPKQRNEFLNITGHTIRSVKTESETSSNIIT